MNSPFSSWGMPQANSITSIPRATSPRASSSTLPCSAVISRARSSRWRSASSRKAKRIRERAVSDVSRQAVQAAPRPPRPRPRRRRRPGRPGGLRRWPGRRPARCGPGRPRVDDPICFTAVVAPCWRRRCRGRPGGAAGRPGRRRSAPAAVGAGGGRGRSAVDRLVHDRHHSDRGRPGPRPSAPACGACPSRARTAAMTSTPCSTPDSSATWDRPGRMRRWWSRPVTGGGATTSPARLGGQPQPAGGQDARAGVVTVTLVDGVVLARSVFNHSVNYRCAMVFGMPEVLADPAEKLAASGLSATTSPPASGSTPALPSTRSWPATTVLRLALDEAR